jgi:hypothetical protein
MVKHQINGVDINIDLKCGFLYKSHGKQSDGSTLSPSALSPATYFPCISVKLFSHSVNESETTAQPSLMRSSLGWRGISNSQDNGKP